MALVRAYLRQSAGPAPVGGNNVTSTGWPNSLAATGDATLASTGPTVISDALGDGTGPGAQSTGQLGYVAGGLVGGTTWAQGCGFRWTANGSFRNVFGDDISTTFALYANSGSLILVDGSNTASAIATLNINTTYLVGIERDASGYRVYVDDMASVGAAPTEVYDSTTDGGWTGGPTTTPTLGMGAYGGSQAGITGVHLAWIIGDGASDYTATIFDDLKGQVAPTTEQTLTGSAPAPSGATVPAGGTIATGTAQALIGSTPVAAGATIPAGGTIAALTGQSLTGSAAIPSGATVPTGGSVALGSAQSLTASVAAASGATIPTGGSIATVAPSGLNDEFDGTSGSALTGYTTISASSLSDVTQTSGSYRAAVTGSTNNTTTWFDADTGRFDGRAVTGNFIAVYHNVRVRTPSSDTTAPTVSGEYIFTGVQIQTDLLNPSDLYIQATVGNRGPVTGVDQGQTLELKITVDGDSAVIDVGPNAVVGMALDLWVERRGAVIVFRWRTVGGSTWSADLTMPSVSYTLPATVYVGPVTYAFNHFGPDFAGYIDRVEELPVAQQLTGSAAAPTEVTFPAGGTIAAANDNALTGSAAVATEATIPAGGSIASSSDNALTGGTPADTDATVPTGGSVASGPALSLTGSVAVAADATVPAGGNISRTLILAGSTPPATEVTIPAGGSVALGTTQQLTGSSAAPTGATVPAGGTIGTVVATIVPAQSAGVYPTLAILSSV